MNLASYLSERISDLEKMLETTDPSTLKFSMLKAKYDAFVEIEDYIAGNINEDGEEMYV